MTCKWCTMEDGYRFETQLVDRSNQRIVGAVMGSAFEPAGGWRVHAELPGETVALGRYATKEAAKAALEDYWKAKPREAQ